MIGLALAFLVVGVIFLFFIPWVGIPVGIVGVVLAGLYLFGVGRRATTGETPEPGAPPP
jgi:uncharacterized membrane protein YccF (DUF307 family)